MHQRCPRLSLPHAHRRLRTNLAAGSQQSLCDHAATLEPPDSGGSAALFTRQSIYMTESERGNGPDWYPTGTGTPQVLVPHKVQCSGMELAEGSTLACCGAAGVALGEGAGHHCYVCCPASGAGIRRDTSRCSRCRRTAVVTVAPLTHPCCALTDLRALDRLEQRGAALSLRVRRIPTRAERTGLCATRTAAQRVHARHAPRQYASTRWQTSRPGPGVRSCAHCGGGQA